MLTNSRTICLALSLALLVQPAALAQTQPGNPPPSNQPSSSPSTAETLLKFGGVVALYGAGLGLVSYSGRNVLSSNESFSWAGTGLSLGGGALGSLAGAALGGAIGFGIGSLIGGNARAGGAASGMALGGILGGILGGLWAGDKGNDIATRNANAGSASSGGNASNSATPASSAAPPASNGPGGASGALRGILNP